MQFAISWTDGFGAKKVAKIDTETFKMRSLRTWLNQIQDTAELRIYDEGVTDKVVAYVREAKPHEKRNKRHKWYRWIAKCEGCEFEFHECKCEELIVAKIDYMIKDTGSDQETAFDFMSELAGL